MEDLQEQLTYHHQMAIACSLIAIATEDDLEHCQQLASSHPIDPVAVAWAAAQMIYGMSDTFNIDYDSAKVALRSAAAGHHQAAHNLQQDP